MPNPQTYICLPKRTFHILEFQVSFWIVLGWTLCTQPAKDLPISSMKLRHRHGSVRSVKEDMDPSWARWRLMDMDIDQKWWFMGIARSSNQLRKSPNIPWFKPHFPNCHNTLGKCTIFQKSLWSISLFCCILLGLNLHFTSQTWQCQQRCFFILLFGGATLSRQLP